MRKRSRRSEQFRRAGGSPADAPAPPPPRWYDGAWLPMLSAVLLTLSFAPISQFYLAWIALVPLLLFVRRATTNRRLFLWSWAAGTVFFALNIWWLSFVTVPGTMGSVAYMGLYWGFAAVIVRASGWANADAPGRRALLAVFGIAAIWTGCEWLRGNLGSGWPWSFLGYTQTPVLAMCQVADVTGVYGVTFWLVAVNVLAALLVIHRPRVRALLAPLLGVAAMLALVLAYGIVRMSQTHTTPGPRVMVVQSNFPQSNTGDKGAPREELVAFHVNATRAALEAEAKAGRKVDLVAWSETMMPNLNPKARLVTKGTEYGLFLEETFQQIASMCFDFRTALLTGGEYAGELVIRDDRWIDRDRRNAAYFFEPTGTLSDLRYDKVHLVPFGEYVPFKETIPPLYRLFMWFSPYDFDYNLVPGKWESLTVFTLTDAATPSRFVVPICFEDADPRLLAAMFRPDGSRPGKRANFIVNITNDGWFSQPQLSQHLQIARFRSIENRVPTARSVNTGISAFIDSVGRVHERLPAHVEGTLTSNLPLDPRMTLYTRFGDLFALGCTALTAVVVIAAIARSRRKRAVLVSA